MNIILDPRGTFSYATYYIYGLEQVFGKSHVCFDISPFRGLSYTTRQELNSGMPLVIRGDRDYRVFLDLEDRAIIFNDRYEWCNVYGKVNPTEEQCSTLDKLLPLGPEFGIQLYSKFSTMVLAIKNYLKGRSSSCRSFKDYLGNYAYSFIRRRRMEQFETPAVVRTNYIFHASTLWYNEFAWTNTNKYRGEFLKACAKAGMEIEGGLYYLGESPDVLREMPDYAKYKTEYKDFIYTKRLSMDDYIRKTKESVFVFNTPSVCECHGWKLAEYLCMGKAIISSPLTRVLPGPGLEHGRNVYFVHKPEEIGEAVNTLMHDSDLRHHLEQGAQEYYTRWIEPTAVIKEICKRLKIHI